MVTDNAAKGVRSLIIGAGDAGHMFLREIRRHPELKIKPVGLLDDDRTKQGMVICGATVLGTLAELELVIDEHDIKQVILAMPTAKPEVIRKVVQGCTMLGVGVRTMPGLYEVINDCYKPTRLREVQIEDLLHREETKVDLAEIGSYITGKRVLVTGAGGSIGSELCRQILCCKPAELVILGHGENSIFNIHRELLPKADGVSVVPVIADVQSTPRIAGVFAKHKPQVVFHAAAHKHVPLMELNAVEAIKNNVWGTSNVAGAAAEHGVERFVLVSSDKAVNPTNVMGATKRAAEMVIQRAGAGSNTKFMAVRFGNVLGSRGSGKPVKIVDMARDLISLSGLVPDVDIKIEFTGIRPGDKMYEELLTAEEGTVATKHKKIMTARQTAVAGEVVDELVATLTQMVHNDYADNAALIRLILDASRARPYEQVAAAKDSQVAGM